MFPDIASLMPSEEEVDKRFMERVELSKSNVNCFTYWYPSVRKNNIPSPASEVFEITPEAYKSVLQEEYRPDLFNDVSEKIKALGDLFGFPVFMKTGLFSNKHSFEQSCLIKESDSVENITQKIMNLNYTFAMMSPEMSLKIIVREYLDVKPSFYAFGSTPIVEEYRVFAKDGEVEGWQAYWPQDSILDPDIEDWKERLADIKQPDDETLKTIVEYAKKVTEDLGGYWSVDFLIERNGKAFLIDMANGNQSFKDTENFHPI